MKKILCPTDFSPVASQAIAFAAAIAQRAHVHLTLMHVLHLPIVDTSETALVAGELLGEQMRDAGERLSALCQEVESRFGANGGSGFTCDFILKEALLTDLAEHLTKREGYDLIVMGTTGGGNKLEELLVGSNTESVIEEVKCPVLAIPAKADSLSLEKIVFASDYTPDDRGALQQIAQLAKLFNASVDVVHVVKESTPETQAKAERFWREVEQALPEVSLRFQEVVSRHREEGIKSYYKEVNGSVVAILRKEKRFLQDLFSQSLTERLTYQAEVPLLVLHGRKH